MLEDSYDRRKAPIAGPGDVVLDHSVIVLTPSTPCCFSNRETSRVWKEHTVLYTLSEGEQLQKRLCEVRVTESPID